MSKRKMRGPFGRRSVALIVFAIVVTMGGLVYAHWWTSLHVDATINTGSVGIQWGEIWTNDDGVDNGDGEDGSWPEVWDERWYGDSSADPGNYDGYRYDKDVAGCWADGGDGDWISINIDNGYPSYHCTAQTSISNVGSVPVKALPSGYEVMRGDQDCDWWFTYNEEENWFYDRTGYNVQNDEYLPGDWRPYVENGGNDTFDAGDWWILRNDADGLEYVDKDGSGDFTAGDEIVFGGCNFHGDHLAVEHYGDGNFAWGYYDEFDDFHAEITGQMPSLFECGTQIDPWFGDGVQYNFHVEQEAQQNATYRFTAHQEFVNWNEFDYGWCEGGPAVEEGKPDPTAKGFGVRYRNFGTGTGNEVYLGQGDLGTPNRVEQAVAWGEAQHVMFMYDGEGTLTTEVEGYGPLVKTGIDESCAEYLVMSVVARDDGSMMELNNVYLNGWHLGDFPATAWAWNEWTVYGIDFAEPFQLDGELIATGPFSSSNENNKVELLVGCTP